MKVDPRKMIDFSEAHNLLWIDTETTGVDPKKNAIVQIAAFWGENQFNEFIKPHQGAIISQQALVINKRTVEELRGFQDSSVALRKFLAFLPSNKKLVIAGYNVEFDKNFLFEFFQRHGCFLLNFFSPYIFDVYGMVQLLHGMGLIKTSTGKLKLKDVWSSLFDGEFDAHNALGDIKATQEVFFACTKLLRELHV